MSDDVNDFIRDRLRKAREEKGLSQQALALKTANTRGMVSDYYETGRVRINAGELYRLVVSLENPITFFFPTAQESDLTGEEHSLIAAVRDLDALWRKYLLEMAAGLVDLALADQYEQTRAFDEAVESAGL